MDRHFMMQSGQHHGWFCGKCGKHITPDLYNANKHAEVCGFSVMDTGDSRNVANDHEPGYRLSSKDGNLCLEICFPELVNIPGFQDRFRGMRWVPVMEAVFHPDQRVPVITENTSGIDLGLWLSLIRAGKCCRIHDSEIEVIREVFPGIIGIYSLQMFVHIYCNKGFRHSRLLTEQVAQRVLRAGWEMPGMNSGRAPSSSVRRSRSVRMDTQNKTPLHAVLLRGKDDVRFLRITVDPGKRPHSPSFLFSRGYAACTPGTNLNQVLHRDYLLDADSKSAVRRYAQLYPEYNLKQYLEKSSNILIPLIAPDYHSLLEISAKAVVPAVAENMDRLSQFKQDPSLCMNLREAFGLPLHVLRTLNPDDVREELMDKLATVYSCDPGFLQFDRYTHAMLDFYQCLRLPDSAGQKKQKAGAQKAETLRAGARNTGGRPQEERCLYRATALERGLTARQVLQILRYLYKHSVSWELLRDYLNACELLGEYPYGFLPRISLADAHDRVVERILLKRGDIEQDSFRRVVQSEKYLSLTTDKTEEDRELFREEPFVIIPPREKKDLFMESEAMHNCVRIYSRAVTNESCMIFFLRKKEKPNTSYGTIEVRGNGLFQAKGFANSRLEQPAQDFIRKWCAIKHLRIMTRDIEKA